VVSPSIAEGSRHRAITASAQARPRRVLFRTLGTKHRTDSGAWKRAGGPARRFHPRFEHALGTDDHGRRCRASHEGRCVQAVHVPIRAECHAGISRVVRRCLQPPPHRPLVGGNTSIARRMRGLWSGLPAAIAYRRAGLRRPSRSYRRLLHVVRSRIAPSHPIQRQAAQITPRASADVPPSPSRASGGQREERRRVGARLAPVRPARRVRRAPHTHTRTHRNRRQRLSTRQRAPAIPGTARSIWCRRGQEEGPVG
jgi:hypothetical protein